MFGPSSPLSSRRSRRISPVSARTAGSKDGAAGAGGTAGGATSPRLSPRHDKGPKGDRMDRAADKGPQMSPLSPSSSTDVSQNQSPRLSPRLSPSLSSSPVETPKMSTPTSRPEGGVFRSISAASTAHTLTGISESGLTIAHAAMEAMQEETAKAAAVRMQLEDQSRRLEAQLASANQMLGPLIQSHQQVQHLLQQMRPQARKQVFDGAVSPKVPLSPRQVSCGPVARRTIHVASTVRSPRMVAPPVVATVATVPPTVPGVATPIVRSVSIPGHVTPTPMAGYPTERWSSSVPNNVSQLASVASAVRASAEDGLESQSLKQLQSSNSIGIQTADGQEDEELLQKLMLVAEAASLITERSGMLEVKEARDRLQEVLAQGRARNLPKERLAPTERQRRRIHNLYQDLKGHLRIYCRVRPLNIKGKRNKDREALKVDGTKLQVPLTGDMFEFDGVFDMTSSQEDIFDASCDLAQSALDGRNVTVFCYGITGAGKTYTMYGAPGADGLTQRMIGEVFRKARLGGDNVTISGSMMELYNNYLVDLLRPIDWQGRQNPTLSLRLDKSGSVQVEGLAKEPAMDETELQAMFHRGLEQRAVAAHAMNAESSRSHVLFTVYVTREVEEGEGQVVSKLHFCDLGGCERLKKTEVEKEDRRLEAIEINKSLSALGDVIEAVAKKKKYVPYRNHKLTQLLQDAIGGGAKANALKLANRAKSIVNLSADVKCPPSSPSSPGAAGTRRP